MIPPLVGALGAWILAWAALGFPFDPIWWLSLLTPGVWAAGIAYRTRGCLVLGLLLSVGLASAVAFVGHRVAALGVTTLALWTWDLGLLWVSRLQRGDAESTRRLSRAALVRSTVLCFAAFLGGVGFAALRISIPFWWLVGGALGAWIGLVLIVRGFRRTYTSGGEASGNRSSSSGPIA